MNIIPEKNNVHFGIMFIFLNSEQNEVFPVFIVLPGILLFCSLILSYNCYFLQGFVYNPILSNSSSPIFECYFKVTFP